VKVFTFITATIPIAFLYYLIFAQFYPTGKERKLMREIDKMKENYEILSMNLLPQIQDVLADIQVRDSNLYRTIFESEPPRTVLQAGFGSVNRFETLEGYFNSGLMLKTSQRSESLLKRLQIETKMLVDMEEKAREKADQLKTRPAIQPIENKDLSHTAAGFGMRMHPFYRAKTFHEGMDFTAPIGTPVRATGDGEVSDIYKTGPQGLKIVIDHGYGYKTIYAHLEKFSVKKGQKITRGESIGTVGNSGMSTAPHLHYEVHKNGKPVNPINYYLNDLSPAAFARIRDLSNLGRTFD
jgi:murein DD-endopeptidase MepM/ murein hydrolase activator NlpD